MSNLLPVLRAMSAYADYVDAVKPTMEVLTRVDNPRGYESDHNMTWRVRIYANGRAETFDVVRSHAWGRPDPDDVETILRLLNETAYTDSDADPDSVREMAAMLTHDEDNPADRLQALHVAWAVAHQGSEIERKLDNLGLLDYD